MAIRTTMDAICDLPIFAAARARETGLEAGQACMDKAARTAGFDAVAARAEILTVLVKAGRPMSGEQLVDHCQSVGLVPHDARAFGPVFGSLARKGLIESVGFAARRKGHGTSGARMWRATDGR